MKFVSKKSGYQETSTRSGIVNTALTKSAVVNNLRLVRCYYNNAVITGIQIIILNIYVLILISI